MSSSSSPSVQHLKDDSKGLDVVIHKRFLDKSEEHKLFDEVKALPWFRVKYKSERHGNTCETPCWTNMFGGFSDLKPYQPIPPCLEAISQKITDLTGARFNAILTRLYFDGRDNIAWHTDGRTFLGDEPVIASLSLGASSLFELRRMTNVWPTTSTPNQGIDKLVSPISLSVGGGDLMVMQGKTQQFWHHRVPKEKQRGPRININFRYILPVMHVEVAERQLAARGIRAFYKYMVSGDEKTDAWEITAPSFKYDDIQEKHAPIKSMFLAQAKKASQASTPSSSTGPQEVLPSGDNVDTAMTGDNKNKSENEIEKAGKEVEKESVVDCFSTTTTTIISSWTCHVCTFINESHSSIEQHSPQECVMCGSIGTEECNPTKGNETSNSSSRGNPPPKKRKADITSFFKPKK